MSSLKKISILLSLKEITQVVRVRAMKDTFDICYVRPEPKTIKGHREPPIDFNGLLFSHSGVRSKFAQFTKVKR